MNSKPDPDPDPILDPISNPDHNPKFLWIQALASMLLENPRPECVYRVFNLLREMMTATDPKTHAVIYPLSLDRSMCSALLENKAVVEKLMAFCIPHAKEAPTSDLEWMAIVGGEFFRVVFGPRGRGVRVVVVRSWPDDRQVLGTLRI